jgi:hypothetical protein
VRKLTAGSSFHAGLSRTKSTIAATAGVRVVEQHVAADSNVRCEMPPVEDRVRESMRPVDQHEIERTWCPGREHVLRQTEPERQVCRVDPECRALRENRLALAGSGEIASWTAPREVITIVLEPDPTSSVAQPGCTVSSSQASADQASPR